ncbi:hypothetical protein BMG03_00910 [Thioclava nitratireducens]|uniref:Uncharacterized protein n=1 Tax=Thioclava nitratireducens TaxID=1915078 RepID=A0ABM6ICU1_9RHOB|nr:hypothetical protein [Thioclava nitratireducens]AQS46515.1 hypothetical protein BMG03_00910 [Thioclava nitratireducens]
MKKPQINEPNACARIISKIAHTCFLIGAETEFDAHFDWHGHVNLIRVMVFPKGVISWHPRDAILRFEEYLKLPSTARHPDFWTGTCQQAEKFAVQLNAFREENRC